MRLYGLSYRLLLFQMIRCSHVLEISNQMKQGKMRSDIFFLKVILVLDKNKIQGHVQVCS